MLVELRVTPDMVRQWRAIYHKASGDCSCPLRHAAEVAGYHSVANPEVYNPNIDTQECTLEALNPEQVQRFINWADEDSVEPAWDEWLATPNPEPLTFDYMA